MSPKRTPVAPARRNARRQDEAPARLTVRGLLVIVAGGALATLLGVAIVKTHFSTRNYEIEARRIQDLTSVRRDETRRLETQLGAMKSDDSLREAAVGHLGMIEPPADSVRRLDVDPARVAEYGRAAREAREKLERERGRLEAVRGEVY